ncbi:MAG TPA: hypothetical protein VLA13_05340 [Massilibacterium sp.]|nr:hypothetical protein [Massilibacterium sp.]
MEKLIIENKSMLSWNVLFRLMESIKGQTKGVSRLTYDKNEYIISVKENKGSIRYVVRLLKKVD